MVWWSSPAQVLKQAWSELRWVKQHRAVEIPSASGLPEMVTTVASAIVGRYNSMATCFFSFLTFFVSVENLQRMDLPVVGVLGFCSASFLVDYSRPVDKRALLSPEGEPKRPQKSWQLARCLRHGNLYTSKKVLESEFFAKNQAVSKSRHVFCKQNPKVLNEHSSS